MKMEIKMKVGMKMMIQMSKCKLKVNPYSCIWSSKSISPSH
jgi:hypothetical protein